MGDEKSYAPNLTPHKTGLARWSADDIATTLAFGITPDYEVLGEPMSEVIRHGTSNLTKGDLNAIATYLKSLAPLEGTKRKR